MSPVVACEKWEMKQWRPAEIKINSFNVLKKRSAQHQALKKRSAYNQAVDADKI